MFQEWLKFLRQWMFWWLPGADEPADTRRSPEPPTASAKPETGTTGVDSAATRQPSPDDAGAPSTPSDDLSVIKGIGPGIVRKLDALGIKTFADLAKADPDDLASKLALRPVTPARVRQWIADATRRTGSS